MADNDPRQDYAKVVARAWSDEAFKAQLLSDPAAALKEAGVAVPDGVTVEVVENTETLFHLVLPPRPDEELSDEALEKVAGGGCPICDLSFYGRLTSGP